MEGYRHRITAIRNVSILLVLSVGLTGCKTCKNLGSKLGLYRRQAEVIETLPPEIGEVTPRGFTPTPVGGDRGKVATLPGDDRPPARPDVDNPPVPEEALETVHFDYDSAVLTDVARRILNKNIEWLREHPDVNIQIEGHCDERGTEEYNMNLGARRAKNVMRYLVQNGINEKRLFTISFGEQVPIDPGHDESAWWKNRRAEFSRL